MNTLLIDTNIIVSALIKDGLIRSMITNLNSNFVFPNVGLNEIYAHKDDIKKKSGLDDKEFDTLLLRIMKYIRLIPLDIIIGFKKKAIEVMKNIDEDDSIFIAAALSLNCPIWSDDKHLKRQSEIKVYNTQEIITILSKNGF